MKILFVCRANIGRSQMAEALFNKYYSDKGQASSAGTQLTEERQKMKLGEVVGAENVIECMSEKGLDLRKNSLNQILPEQINNFDKVIIMAESETIPDFLLKSKNSIFWDIKDPKGTDLKGHRKTKEKIKNKIEEFMRR